MFPLRSFSTKVAPTLPTAREFDMDKARTTEGASTMDSARTLEIHGFWKDFRFSSAEQERELLKTVNQWRSVLFRLAAFLILYLCAFLFNFRALGFWGLNGLYLAIPGLAVVYVAVLAKFPGAVLHVPIMMGSLYLLGFATQMVVMCTQSARLIMYRLQVENVADMQGWTDVQHSALRSIVGTTALCSLAGPVVPTPPGACTYSHSPDRQVLTYYLSVLLRFRAVWCCWWSLGSKFPRWP